MNFKCNHQQYNAVRTTTTTTTTTTTITTTSESPTRQHLHFKQTQRQICLESNRNRIRLKYKETFAERRKRKKRFTVFVFLSFLSSSHVYLFHELLRHFALFRVYCLFSMDLLSYNLVLPLQLLSNTIREFTVSC